MPALLVHLAQKDPSQLSIQPPQLGVGCLGPPTRGNVSFVHSCANPSEEVQP